MLLRLKSRLVQYLEKTLLAFSGPNKPRSGNQAMHKLVNSEYIWNNVIRNSEQCEHILQLKFGERDRQYIFCDQILTIKALELTSWFRPFDIVNNVFLSYIFDPKHVFVVTFKLKVDIFCSTQKVVFNSWESARNETPTNFLQKWLKL